VFTFSTATITPAADKVSFGRRSKARPHLHGDAPSSISRREKKARAAGQLVSLWTGDGMALTFFGEFTEAVHCARQIVLGLKPEDGFTLRIPALETASAAKSASSAGGQANKGNDPDTGDSRADCHHDSWCLAVLHPKTTKRRQAELVKNESGTRLAWR
jgi:hypothetical protein